MTVEGALLISPLIGYILIIVGMIVLIIYKKFFKK
ncbi:unnamed protein product [Commensalibacter papalotli (ex Botero et al. 2024)]|uniref:Uncharacterized protein n=1 Tax=Commensalibacter papalotli (ex Botero et al. 2024) TaxID=2972766 RepID=A0ABN8W872_9PROT|nr:unnamed protein product [Commensalibacter papalotli (ex Botero et al. 2024)]CAI3927525.1 unnamed protein product [Commensalibacter papalotli (ex Botero et al. 2024)]